MDYYLDYNNCLNRIINEYNKYGKIIIAYDFDDTIFDFHNKGRKYNDVINLLRECKDIGRFICFTASKEERYPKIRLYINDNKIPCDSINTGFKGMPNGIKPYYNILLDDRAGLSISYNILKDLLKYIKESKKEK